MSEKGVLITGVAGLIGSRMADWIIENKPEYKVIGIDNLFGGYIENVNEKVDFYKRDLSFDSISDIFEKYDIEYVFHFAAYAAEGLSPFIRKFNDMNNMVTRNAFNDEIKKKDNEYNDLEANINEKINDINNNYQILGNKIN